MSHLMGVLAFCSSLRKWGLRLLTSSCVQGVELVIEGTGVFVSRCGGPFLPHVLQIIV